MNKWIKAQDIQKQVKEMYVVVMIVIYLGIFGISKIVRIMKDVCSA
jgi:hypothetical protein